MKDGGPAFGGYVRRPVTDLSSGMVADDVPVMGMSLRDYFAAAALTGMCARGGSEGHLHEYAYEIADAMLAEREKQ